MIEYEKPLLIEDILIKIRDEKETLSEQEIKKLNREIEYHFDSAKNLSRIMNWYYDEQIEKIEVK